MMLKYYQLFLQWAENILHDMVMGKYDDRCLPIFHREDKKYLKIIIGLQKIMINLPFRSFPDHQNQHQKSRSILEKGNKGEGEASIRPAKQHLLIPSHGNSPMSATPSSPRSFRATYNPTADLTRSYHPHPKQLPNKQKAVQTSFKQNSRIQVMEKANKPLTAQLYAKHLSFRTFPNAKLEPCQKDKPFQNISNNNLKSNLQLRQTITTSKGFLKNTLPPRANKSPSFTHLNPKQNPTNQLNISKQKENHLTPSKFMPKHARTRTAAEDDPMGHPYLKFKLQQSQTNTPKTSTPRTNTPSMEKITLNANVKNNTNEHASRTVSNFQKFLAKRLSTTLSPRATVRSIQLSDFDIGPCKGQGRFGKVYPAYHRRTGFLLAIKKIKKELVQGMLKQFIGQLKIGLYVCHPNVVKTYGIFHDSLFIYILMEYMEEGSLYGLVKKGKMDEEDVSLRLLEVCQAVSYLHSLNIIHRDIKPENIVVSNKICKLCDFGWAVCSKERRKTYCGTLDYVCPQILEGAAYDNQVDIWAIGVLAYEMLTGKAPFYHISRQETMMSIVKCDFSFPESMSKNARSFIAKALQKNPDKRTTIAELLKDQFLKQEQSQ